MDYAGYISLIGACVVHMDGVHIHTLMSELGGVGTSADDGELWRGHESTGGRLGRHLEHQFRLYLRRGLLSMAKGYMIQFTR